MPEPLKCSVCGVAAISPHSVRRGITRCRRCAAKARGMPTETVRRGGQARQRQVATAMELLRASSPPED